MKVLKASIKQNFDLRAAMNIFNIQKRRTQQDSSSARNPNPLFHIHCYPAQFKNQTMQDSGSPPIFIILCNLNALAIDEINKT